MTPNKVLEYNEKWLNFLGKKKEICNTYFMWKFLEISAYSFSEIEKSLKESYVLKSNKYFLC